MIAELNLAGSSYCACWLTVPTMTTQNVCSEKAYAGLDYWFIGKKKFGEGNLSDHVCGFQLLVYFMIK